MLGFLVNTAVASGLLHAQRPTFIDPETGRFSRQRFEQAVHRIRSRPHTEWDGPRVERELGPPDEIIYPKYGGQIWHYGTIGKGTVPSLGAFHFRPDSGKLEIVESQEGDPPSEDLISEQELRKAMQLMYAERGRRQFSDPLRLIRVTNSLLPRGHRKALAVLREYARIEPEGGSTRGQWIMWLARVMFEPKSPPGYFSIPLIGAMAPKPPEELRSWPIYPLMLIDDIPISLFRGAALGGVPESAYMYINRDSMNWTMRKKPLRPPDDPFPTYRRAIEPGIWPLPKADPNKTRFTIPYEEDEGYALREILWLVGSVYRPKEMQDDHGRPYINGLDVAKFHAEFLKLGAKWNVKKQDYEVPPG